MGSISSEVIKINGVELDFLWAVHNWLMNFDSNITCEIVDSEGNHIGDDPDDMTWEINVIRNIDYTLDTNVKLRLQSHPESGYQSGIATNGYNIAFYCGENLIANKNINGTSYGPYYGDDTLRFHNPDVSYGTDRFYYNSVANRQWTVSKYISSTCKILWLGSDVISDYKDAEVIITKFKDSKDNWRWTCGCMNIGSPRQPVIEGHQAFKSDGSDPATKSPMFSYEARTGYLDFISHSSFVSGSTKAFASADIYDCTTVNMGDTLSLKDGANFLAIGAHSMVRLDDEEG